MLRRGSSGCVVPNHRELKTGTLADVRKQAARRRNPSRDGANLTIGDPWLSVASSFAADIFGFSGCWLSSK